MNSKSKSKNSFHAIGGKGGKSFDKRSHASGKQTGSNRLQVGCAQTDRSKHRDKSVALQTFPKISFPDKEMIGMSTSALAQMIGSSFMNGSYASILGQIVLFAFWKNDSSQLTDEQITFLQSMSSGKDLQTLVNHLRSDDVFQVINLLNKFLRDSKSVRGE